MKFGQGLRKGTLDRLKLALGQDASIVTDRREMEKHEGVLASYLISLGLTAGDLLRLERCGFAKRGYTKNLWTEGEKLPNGKTVPDGQRYVGKGTRVRWVLVVEGNT